MYRFVITNKHLRFGIIMRLVNRAYLSRWAVKFNIHTYVSFWGSDAMSTSTCSSSSTDNVAICCCCWQVANEPNNGEQACRGRLSRVWYRSDIEATTLSTFLPVSTRILQTERVRVLLSMYEYNGFHWQFYAICSSPVNLHPTPSVLLVDRSTVKVLPTLAFTVADWQTHS